MAQLLPELHRRGAGVGAGFVGWLNLLTLALLVASL
jgi:hypothetical protein